jgi:hypothetical protein
MDLRKLLATWKAYRAVEPLGDVVVMKRMRMRGRAGAKLRRALPCRVSRSPRDRGRGER